MLDWLRDTLDDPTLTRGQRLQSLWSGYGEVVRYHRSDGSTVVVKQVEPPSADSHHPRGWNTDRSHARKLASYAVEHAWHRDWSHRCDEACRVPACLATWSDGDRWVFVLEDLDAAGYPGRDRPMSDARIRACLDWLAAFHATFLGQEPVGLWPVGTYWHLATRPDELDAMDHARLRAAAGPIDHALSSARFQTLVHGDAKVANFCFGQDASAVAAVDFQYVGGGCGMKDVTYFLGSVLGSDDLARDADRFVDGYFATLRARLEGEGVDRDALESEWRGLHDWAWADFMRFVAGWAPGHAKWDRYGLQCTERVLCTLASDAGPSPRQPWSTD